MKSVVPVMYVEPTMTQRTRNSARIVTIPSAIRERRLRRFMSPEDLQNKSGVGLGTIKAIEGSPKSVHLSTVEKLAKALECHPSDISKIVTKKASA